MTTRFDAPFVRWATERRPARFDLAGSNILACTLDDLPGARDVVELTGGTEAGYAPLVDAIGARYGIPADHVTTAQGASSANFLVCAALVGADDEVLVERPGYDALLGAPQILGARTTRFDRDFAAGFALDPERVRQAITPRTRLIVITSPHNPTGVLSSAEALDEVGRIAAANGAYVLVDEVYLDIATAERRDAPILGPAAGRGDVFLSTSSLNKSYGLSGLRCGWILSSPAVARRLHRVRDVVAGSSSIVTDRLGVLAFSQIDRLIERSRALIHENGGIVREFLRSRTELEWIDPGGGTVVFPRIARVSDSSHFAERLLTLRDTAVVPGRFFEAPAHFRLGFGGSSAALRNGLEALGAALDARDW
jgi:aspartate/methionine/tyrosine aminotransferase